MKNSSNRKLFDQFVGGVRFNPVQQRKQYNPSDSPNEVSKTKSKYHIALPRSGQSNRLDRSGDISLPKRSSGTVSGQIPSSKQVQTSNPPLGSGRLNVFPRLKMCIRDRF